MLRILSKLLFLYCGLLGFANLAFAEADTIYVYADSGVGPNSLADTLDFFSTRTKYKVSTLYGLDIIAGHWQENAVLLVFPGGADVPYTEKLNGIGNNKIAQYVNNGGKFLGICAGAYYASAAVDYGRDTDMAIVGARELKFFPGTSVGPMYATATLADRRDAKIVSITWKGQKLNQPLALNQEVPVYYLGGGYFENALKYSQTKVLASYDCCQQYPAVVSNKVGLGLVILSGVHFEYKPKYNAKTESGFKSKILQMNQQLRGDAQNKLLQKQILFELFYK